MFALHPQLAKDAFFVCDLPLSSTLLLNNKHFPWIILVPRLPDMRELIDLPHLQQHALLDEIALASRIMQTMFGPDKLNIAALGNQVPQLHIHIIARYSTDSAWPQPVWGVASAPYPAIPSQIISALHAQFSVSSPQTA